MKKSDLSPLEKGNIGERFTVRYLRRKWYKIRERQMRNQYSEIDIIAEKRDVIVFVEVKTRTTGQLLSPSFAVDSKKQKKIISAALGYIQKHNIKKQVRFDVAEVYLDKDTYNVSNINYIENAFSAGGSYTVF